MRLDRLLAVLEAVAPSACAASWDRVGLHAGRRGQNVRTALLTIDLTEPVLDEARAIRAELVVAYHPPIFRPLATLAEERWKERLLVAAVRRRIAIYSPHTALDAVPGGIADWLAAGLGPGRARAIGGESADLPGPGRLHRLRRPVTARTLSRRVKQHLGLAHLLVAVPDPRARLATIAVCPGAGGSVFDGVAADAYLTGEMQHHQALELAAEGRTVLLAGHAASERPYLPLYRERLLAAGGDGVDWRLSRTDRSPLDIV